MTDNDENPPLHPILTEHIPNDSWVPAAMALMPDGWVNVHIWAYDRILGCDLYVVEHCPGILHFESTVTEKVIQQADDDGELFSEWGCPYDDHPVVVGVETADPPHRYSVHVDPHWKPAYLVGGYLDSCPQDRVREVLVAHGFADAIPKPDGWVALDD